MSPRFHSFSFIQSTAPPNKQQNAFGMDLMLTLEISQWSMVHKQLTLLLLGERLIGTVSQHLGTVGRDIQLHNSLHICAPTQRVIVRTVLISHTTSADAFQRRCFPTMQCILDSVSTKSPPWTVGTAEALPLRFGENKQRISTLNRKQETGWWFQIFFIFTPIWGNDPI